MSYRSGNTSQRSSNAPRYAGAGATMRVLTEAQKAELLKILDTTDDEYEPKRQPPKSKLQRQRRTMSTQTDGPLLCTGCSTALKSDSERSTSKSSSNAKLSAKNRLESLRQRLMSSDSDSDPEPTKKIPLKKEIKATDYFIYSEKEMNAQAKQLRIHR